MLSKYVTFFDKECPLKEYPRPQFVRDSYLSLNGKWEFEMSNNEQIPTSFSKTIIVPYCVESILSDICEKVEENTWLFYRKKFNLPKNMINDKIILHFGAVDQYCKVYVNQHFVGEHHHGYLPFSMDVKPFINKNENEIIVVVKDDLNHDYPYGKQSHQNKGIWYTPVSGIWQSVWMEAFSNDAIEQITIKPDIDQKRVRVVVQTHSEEVSLKIYFQNQLIAQQNSKNTIFDIYIEDMHLWSPETPYLYDLVLKTKHDEVRSYFAMRKFSIQNNHFLLNNQLYFIHGVLDQGYFPDGIYTPASYNAYKEDILSMKNLGFNCLRKHIKIEPMIYYYYCDIYGLIVLQDMVNNGPYSFVLDSALPMIGLKQKAFLLKKQTATQKEIFKKTMIETIDYFYNVPCIGYYTIFNEGWGQHESDTYYRLAKEMDDSRIIDSTSGWFKEKESDVESLHIYFKKIKIKKNDLTKPIIISEFGGYAFKIKNHVYDEKSEFGYKKFADASSYMQAIYKLYQQEIIPNIKNGLAGCIYTQLSDVENEINGLLTYDRKICKVDKTLMLEIKKRIKEEFYHE